MHRTPCLLRTLLLCLCLVAVALPFACPAQVGDVADGNGLINPAAVADSQEPNPDQARHVSRDAAPDTDLQTRVDSAYQVLQNRFARLVAALPLLLIAGLIVAASVWLGRWFSHHLHWLRLHSRNPYMNTLLQRIVQTIVTMLGVLLALDLLGATSLVGAVLGSAGVIGLALGFAFKDIAENYIAGILLSLRQPFAPGDHIRLDSHEGKVVALTSRATTLMTLDGNHLQLPNALVFKSVLLNYTRNPKRRFEFSAFIDGGQSIRKAQTTGLDAVTRVEGVLDEPAASWRIVENVPSGIEIRFFGWVDQRKNDHYKVRSESIRVVKAAFASAGIESPRTVYHVARMPDEADDGHSTAEPLMSRDTDTAVNTDLDLQLADAQQQDQPQNLLSPGETP